LDNRKFHMVVLAQPVEAGAAASMRKVILAVGARHEHEAAVRNLLDVSEHD
jgi:hypothetical protein